MIARFASLPSTAAGTAALEPTLATLEPRAILGIGISAVHSAVLSGVTRIPGGNCSAIGQPKRAVSD